MSHIFATPRRWGVVLVLALVVGASGLAFLPGRSAPADAAAVEVSTEDLLSSLPQPREPRAVDVEISRRGERVRREEANSAAWAELGEALMQKARETADASYYGHADRAFRKALALDDKSGDAVTGLAWVASCRHEFEQSREWATKAIALDPRGSRAYGLLGDAAAEMGDYDAALDHYQKMLDVRPDVSSYSRGAHLLFLMGDVRKGTFLMGKALEAGAPYVENRAWCLGQLALMHFQTGNLVAAESVLKMAQGSAAESPHLLAVQARVKAARQDFDGAIACLKKATETAPQLDLLIFLADLHASTGQREEEKKIVQLVESVHQLHKASGVRGDAQMALFHADRDQNLDEALRLAEEEYTTRKSVHVADAVAWCRYKAGKYAEARQASQEARKRKTPEALFSFHAGMIEKQLGDRVAAQKHLYQALSLNPHFHPIHAKTAADFLAELGSKPPEVGAVRETP